MAYAMCKNCPSPTFVKLATISLAKVKACVFHFLCVKNLELHEILHNKVVF